MQYEVIFCRPQSKSQRPNHVCWTTSRDSSWIWNNWNICLTGPKVTVDVREGDDAILPCSFDPVQDIAGKVFDWKKDEGKEVFLFSDGPVYNEGRAGQDRQFSRRVTHFPDELKYGNASIKIRNATVADSGNYTCVFPPDNKQTSIIRLLVGEWLYAKSVILYWYNAYHKSLTRTYGK